MTDASLISAIHLALRRTVARRMEAKAFLLFRWPQGTTLAQRRAWWARWSDPASLEGGFRSDGYEGPKPEAKVIQRPAAELERCLLDFAIHVLPWPERKSASNAPIGVPSPLSQT